MVATNGAKDVADSNPIQRPALKPANSESPALHLDEVRARSVGSKIGDVSEGS